MSQVAEGIYLETKQTHVGTGHTSSNVVFRTFWAVRPAGERVEIYLLDNQLAPTGLAENVSQPELAGKGWMHVPQLQARYDGLKDKLKPVAAPEPPASAKKAMAPEAPAPAPAQAVAAPAQATAPAPPAAKPAAPAKPAGDQPWWELTQKGSNALIKK
jgi:hypothetical protein